ncbi:TRAP transporter large permease subunit [Limibaculum sp. M0105]|uniref:TRAP transporter large permease subunit n=1 Tax=Thermohalobaculum xanthum TaxID=2753746 RepID=A0A8J7M4E9_9RHOB|nr:TRAP transporter large permease subunit [Thermohalobaculum xanthum]MBK0398069.1 TRAP transporter large permease subunit [Thermohalobaculum xanthum]
MELFFLLILILVMVIALGSGYPVAFALPGSAIITIGLAAGAGYLFAGSPDAYFHSGGPTQWLSAGVTNLRGVYWEPERDTLIAIPLFIFMGIMLQRSKIAEDLLVTMAQLFGPVPGGLGISVVFVGGLLAATTGIVGATVVAMGLISLPAMMRHNYSQPLATGAIAASGTLGQIIPPSIVLIILADQLASAVDQADTARKVLYKQSTGEISMPSEYGVVSTSAGDMFLGALVPGLMLVGLYILFILAFALIRPHLAPAVPYEGKYDGRFLGNVILTLVPPLLLIFLVLGSIIGGVATVNQAGAIGAVGAMIMAGYRLHPGGKTTYVPALIAIAGVVLIAVTASHHAINIKNVATAEDRFALTVALIGVVMLLIALVWSGWRALKIENTLHEVMLDTAKTTSLVFIILLGAAMLTAAFRAFGGEELVKDFLNGLPGGFWMKFVIVMAVIFVLGFFLDFIEIAVVVVPIVSPILLADPEANVTAVWLGVMIGLNIQTSFLTPPFGFALFYLRGVAPAAIRTIQMYKGVIAFISLQLIALFIVGTYPPLVNYLPTRASLTAETAPPPLNPKLQYCMEDYVYERFQAEGAAIRTAIDEMSGIDVSYLPKNLARDLKEGLESAAESFPLMDEIKAVEKRLEDGAVEYRPLHRTVRAIERDALNIEERLEVLKTRVERAREESPAIERAKERIEDLEADRDALLAKIPSVWDEAHKAYNEITKADRNARNAYRRAVDAAYKPVIELRDVLAGTDALKELEAPLRQLAADFPSLDGEAAEERFKEEESRVGNVPGAGEIRSLLAKARREVRGRAPDPEKAAEYIQDALAEFEADLAWRTRAVSELAPALERYDEAIKNTIGLRNQPRLPHEQALYVAACSAVHRDISLSF